MPRILIKLATIAALLLITPNSFSAPSEGETIRLGEGQKQFLTLPDFAASVQATQSGIVDVKKGDTRGVLSLVGKSQGTTTITVVLENGQTIEYRVDVAPAGHVRGMEAAVQRLRQINGVTVVAKGSRIHLTGTVTTRMDRQTIADLKTENPGLIVDGTTKEVYENNTIVRTINRVLTENDIANLQAHAYGTQIVLEGSPRDDRQLALALRIAKTMYSGIEDGVSKTSNGAPSVSIEVMFVQINKKNDKQFGIKGLQDAFSGGTADVAQAGKVAPGVGATISPYKGHEKHGATDMIWQVGPLNAFLQLIETKSGARVLSNPRLVARSGTEATFLSGGTFYLTSSQPGTNGAAVPLLLPINYGIELAIMPKLDAIGQIDAKIRTSISDIAATTNDIPAQTKSSVETSVTIKNEQSILLSGLVHKSENKEVSRVPFLADIPLVGELFKTRHLQRDDTELLVIVTMRRVSGAEDLSGAASKLYDKGADDVQFSIFD